MQEGGSPSLGNSSLRASQYPSSSTGHTRRPCIWRRCSDRAVGSCSARVGEDAVGAFEVPLSNKLRGDDAVTRRVSTKEEHAHDTVAHHLVAVSASVQISAPISHAVHTGPLGVVG